jgi:hypothetical protein
VPPATPFERLERHGEEAVCAVDGVEALVDEGLIFPRAL